MSQGHSRRNFFALIGAVTVQASQPVCLGGGEAFISLLLGEHAEDIMAQEAAGSAQTGSLSATLTWTPPFTATGSAATTSTEGVRIRVSRHADLSHPVVEATVAAEATTYRLAVASSTTYYWSLVPVAGGEEAHHRAARGSFTTAAPIRDPQADDDNVRYTGVRAGAHWVSETVVAPASPSPPISPWFQRKHYDGVGPPTFEEVKAAFPVPIVDSEPQILETYWYCWKTLMRLWLFSPSEPDHQAVANVIGLKSWDAWGSSMVWDNCFIMQFARYGHYAYPFITALDNCYARQHENGFICRESDKNNRDVYAAYPVNPPLFAWAEWQWYQLTGNQERLAQVLMPMVKHYEWWVRFQRRQNGLYWTIGIGDGMDDSPRNELMYYTVSATSHQALVALELMRIAKVVGRPDLADYFEAEHTALGKTINQHFWDEKHQVYNDLNRDGRFITELEPGVLCKHGFIFWPMVAEIAPPERVQGLVAELVNPHAFFLPSGVASLSADSAKLNLPTGGYWKGSVWPPIQGLVQSGLKACGRWELAQQLARKYLDALITAYQKQSTITEFLEPYEPVGKGDTDFVGWGGIGPIQNLIEYVLGFDVSAPTQTVTWRITRVDRHGLENLRVGKTKVDLICAHRSDPAAPCHLTVTCDARFTLVVHANGAATTRRFAPGVTKLMIG